MFQARPQMVRAIQWNRDGDHPLVRLTCEHAPDVKCTMCGHPHFAREGFQPIRIAAGDWIIKDEYGDYHVFNQAEFENSFEPAKAGTSIHVGQQQAKWLSSTYAKNMMAGVIAWFQQNRLSKWAQSNEGMPQQMWEHQRYLQQHLDAMDRHSRGE
jgi:hypothetical protein